MDLKPLERAIDDVIVLMRRHGEHAWPATLERLAGRARAGDDDAIRELTTLVGEKGALRDLVLGPAHGHTTPAGEEGRANGQLVHALDTAHAIASDQPVPPPLEAHQRARSKRAVDNLWPKPVRYALLGLLGVVLIAGVVTLLLTPWTPARWVWLLTLAASVGMLWWSERLGEDTSTVGGELTLLAAAVLLGASAVAASEAGLRATTGPTLGTVAVVLGQLVVAWTHRVRSHFAG